MRKETAAANNVDECMLLGLSPKAEPFILHRFLWLIIRPVDLFLARITYNMLIARNYTTYCSRPFS